MKIRKLRFKNINSLAGEWTIDFADPEFASNRIFAITGETASGKTTILDAICYALYGVTPRQKSISNKNNEIMTRGTGECFAELTFETNNGVFRAFRSHNRAHNKPDGALQQPKCRLINDQTNDIITEKINDFKDQICTIIGLDYGQFTKAVLLAQGSFSAFLKGKLDDRAKILAQLSDGEIYEQISTATYNKATEYKNALSDTQGKLEQLNTLSDDDLARRHDELKQLNNSIEELDKIAKKLDEWKKWRLDIDKCNADCQLLAQNSQSIATQIEEFKPQKLRMQDATRANALRDKYNHAIERRKDEANTVEQLETLDNQIAMQTEFRNAAIEDEKQSKLELEREKTIYQNECAPKLIEMRKCDTEIQNATAECNNQNKKVAEHRSALEARAKSLKQAESNRNQYLSERQKLDAQLADFPLGERLRELHSGIESKLQQLKSSTSYGVQQRNKLDTLKANIQKNQETLQQRRDDLKTCELNCEKAQNAYDQNEKLIESLLAGSSFDAIDEEIDSIRKRLEEFNKFNKYIEDRSLLVDGKPCPLCGSLEHPGISQDNVNRTIQELSAKSDALNETKKAYSKANNDRPKLDSVVLKEKAHIESAKTQIKQLEKSISDDKASCEIIESELNDLRQKYNELKKDTCDCLEDAGEANLIQFVQSNEIDECIKELSRRFNQFKSLSERSTTLNNALSDIENDYTREKAAHDECLNTLNSAQSDYDKRLEVLSSLKSDRRAKFGDEDPNVLESSTKAKLAECEKRAQEHRQRATDLNTELSVILEKSNMTKSNLEKIRSEKYRCDNALRDAMAQAGFDSEQTLASAMIPDEELNALKQKDELLRNRQTEIDSQIALKNKELDQHRAKNLTEKSTQDIAQEAEANQAKRDQASQRIGEINHELEDNKNKCSNRDELQRQLQQQLADAQIWNEMNELIGSADGKRFRNYAVTITFEQLLRNANDYLKNFNNRYCIINQSMAKSLGVSFNSSDDISTDDPNTETTNDADDAPKKDKASKKQAEGVKTSAISTEGLSFCVIDNDQGGITRPVSNLSGGESFIVSLALALGLSDMASHRGSNKVSIDTLFLDEGFGTLDENMLRAVTSSLTQLIGNSSKVLGVISHVEELKRAIPTQIVVTKLGASGHSILEGPGVTHR